MFQTHMPRNDEGNFELVLSGTQLGTGVGLLAILCGLFFAIGFSVRGNGAPAAGKIAMQTVQGEGATVVLRPGQLALCPPGEKAAQKPEAVPAPAPQTQAPAPVAAPPAPAATPAPAQKAAPAPVVPPAQPVKPEAAKPAAPPVKAPPAAPGEPQIIEPARGQVFLQVAAGERKAAVRLAGELAKKGFTAYLTPVPGDRLLRVLVEPAAGDVAGAQAALKKAGYQSLVRKY